MGIIKKTLIDIKNVISGVFDSSFVQTNRDGNLLERTEYIINTLLSELPIQSIQSAPLAISPNLIGVYNVQVYDINGNSYSSENIDITNASITMLRSRNGSDFSTIGITQPELTKENGAINIAYVFQGTEWEPLDLYKLVLSGCKIIINEEEYILQTYMWNQIISLMVDIEAEIDTVVSYLAPPAIDSTNNTTIAENLGRKGDTPKTNTSASVFNILKSIVASQTMRRCNVASVIDSTHFTTIDFPTAGTGTFNGWYVYCHQDEAGDVPPRGEYRLVTDWNSNTGIFTHLEFSEPLTTGNKIQIVNPNIYMIQTIKSILDLLPDGGSLLSIAKATDLAILDNKVALDSTVAKADELELVKTKTDLITNDPALQTTLNLVKTKTDLITNDPALQTTLNLVKLVTDSFRNAQKVYPTLVNGVSILTSSNTWVLGSFIEIVPVNRIITNFSITYINISTVSAIGTYELVLYAGNLGSEIEIGRCRFTRATNTYNIAPIPMKTPLIIANTRISGKIASNVSGVQTVVATLYY